jgi:ubiquinone/menaquinone biosynthesis C-methylase UbiE
MFIKLKTFLMTPLIKLVVKHPDIMKSGWFLKAMSIFPAKVSKTYDQKITESGYEYEAALKEGLKRIPIKPRQIIDLATGTGFAAFKVAEIFPDAAIKAIDQAENMIKLASENAEQKNIENVHFMTGNALDLKFPDKHYDLVVTSNAPVYLQEAWRVLKPDGYILISFSFFGTAIDKARKDIIQFMENNGFKLIDLGTAAQGAYILGQKENDVHNPQNH